MARKKRLTAIQAIKEHCRICQGVARGGDYTPVQECTAEWGAREDGCPLWPFRMGRNPNISAETRQKRREIAQARFTQGTLDPNTETAG